MVKASKCMATVPETASLEIFVPKHRFLQARDFAAPIFEPHVQDRIMNINAVYK